jgi:hypothetical protein
VISTAGAESETELAYAGLQRLCGPMLDLLGRPQPGRNGHRRVFFDRRAQTGTERGTQTVGLLGLVMSAGIGVK